MDFLRFLVYDHPYLSERWGACIQTALDVADKEVERLRLAGHENDSNHNLDSLIKSTISFIILLM